MKRLQELRKSKGYKGKDIALILGISVRTYEAYEQDKRKPSIERIKQISTILKCTVDELI